MHYEQPTTSRVEANGVELAVYTWPGEGPPIIFAHANGFHGRCWAPVIAQLAGRHRIAYDQRGHGQSARPAPPYRWPDLGADLAALARALGLRGALGVGHSLGGYATALAAALAPEVFAALLLIDPVILPLHHYIGRLPGVHGAARRRNHWISPAAFYQRLHTRSPFNQWHPLALHAYCNHGLRRLPGGQGYELACPPAVEAEIYHTASEHAIYEAIAAVHIPVTVVRGHPYLEDPLANLSASPTTPDLATAFPNGRDLHLTGHGHFIPMEDPDLVARLIDAAIATMHEVRSEGC